MLEARLSGASEFQMRKRRVVAHRCGSSSRASPLCLDDRPCANPEMNLWPQCRVSNPKRKVAALEAHRSESSERAGKVAAVASAEQGGAPSCELGRLGKNFIGLPFDLYTSAEEKCAGARSLLAA